MKIIKRWSIAYLFFMFSGFNTVHADTGIDGTTMTNSSFTMTGLVSISTLTVSSLSVSTITAVSSATITNLSVTNLNTSAIHLLQTPVFASETSGGSTASTSFVNCGISASITPTSTTSKIIGLVSGPLASSVMNGVAVLGVSGTANGDLYSTTNTPGWYKAYNTSAQGSTVTIIFQDSPGTTSTQTYHMRLAAQANTAYCGGGVFTGAATTMLLMEVQ